MLYDLYEVVGTDKLVFSEVPQETFTHEEIVQLGDRTNYELIGYLERMINGETKYESLFQLKGDE